MCARGGDLTPKLGPLEGAQSPISEEEIGHEQVEIRIGYQTPVKVSAVCRAWHVGYARQEVST